MKNKKFKCYYNISDGEVGCDILDKTTGTIHRVNAVIEGYKSGYLTSGDLPISKKWKIYIFKKIIILEYLRACSDRYSIDKYTFREEWFNLTIVELYELAITLYDSQPLAYYAKIKKEYKLRDYGRDAKLFQYFIWTGDTPAWDIMIKFQNKYGYSMFPSLDFSNFKYIYYFIPVSPPEQTPSPTLRFKKTDPPRIRLKKIANYFNKMPSCESDSYEDAINDPSKLTLTKAINLFKKATQWGASPSVFRELIERRFVLSWNEKYRRHEHARYTYFLNSYQLSYIADNFYEMRKELYLLWEDQFFY